MKSDPESAGGRLVALTAVCLLVLSGAVGACEAGPEAPRVERVTGQFTVVGGEADRQAVEDVAQALVAHAPGICRNLDYEYRSAVRVTVYPDQASLDMLGMNPSMRGYRAYSGNHRIEMVTPRASLLIGGTELPYEQRVLIAVHELVHLVNDEVNPDMPVWLDEGVACFVGPHAVYTYICRRRFPFQGVPSFASLEQSYRTVPAADLFAFTLVELVSDRAGPTGIARLVRSPDRLLEVMRLKSRAELEVRWRQYMRSHYVGE